MMPSLDDLRKRAKEMRLKAGLTQEEAAEEAGVSQSFVAKLESGESVPNYSDAVGLYNSLERLEMEEGKVAGDVMNRDVVSLSPTDTVSDASELMKSAGFSQVPVVEGGECVGSVTSRGILEAGTDEEVSGYMGPAFPTVPRETSLEAVAGLLRSSNAVLVRDGSGIEGIVTAADII